MSGFLDFKEGAGKKVVFSVVLLVLAAVFTIFVYRGRLFAVAKSEIALKCWECGYAETVTREQFQATTTKRNELYIEKVARRSPELAGKLRQIMKDPTQNLGPLDRRQMVVALPTWGAPEWPLVCSKCGKNSFYIARKCPKCGEIFFGFSERGRSVKICPKCGYNLKSKK